MEGFLRVLKIRGQEKLTSRHIIVKFKCITAKENCRSLREKEQITHEGAKIKLTSEF